MFSSVDPRDRYAMIVREHRAFERRAALARAARAMPIRQPRIEPVRELAVAAGSSIRGRRPSASPTR
jgi:hypothetical protein